MTFFKTTLLFASFFLSTSLLTAQASWEAPLKAQLESIRADRSPESVAKSLPIIERIAAANEGAWLPNYYAAHFQLLSHWMTGEEGCETCLEKVDAYLEIAEKAENNSEVMTLRASYYQAMLNVYPMRAPFYGPKAGNLLEAAIAQDANNPRAHSLMGQNLYYTPAMFGGGEDKARPFMQKAVELFEAEKAADRGLLPVWGENRASYMHKKLIASN